MVVHDYFDPRRKKRPHATPNYGHGILKFEIDYYRQAFFFFLEKLLIYEEN